MKDLLTYVGAICWVEKSIIIEWIWLSKKVEIYVYIFLNHNYILP